MTPPPQIELFSIGTELLMGQIQDTNASWMAQQVASLGGTVRRITILDDVIDEIVITLQDSVDRGTRLIVTTGGLGPTADDLTVEAVARMLGVDVIVHEPLVESFMQRRNLASREDLRPGMVKMATAPRGARVYPNPAGVAPCIESRSGDCVIYNLPGPPREVEALFELCVRGPVSELFSGHRASVRVTVGLGESALSPFLDQVMNEHPNTYLKAYVALSERIEGGQRLPVDIVARAETEEDALSLLSQALKSFRAALSAEGHAVEVGDDAHLSGS